MKIELNDLTIGTKLGKFKVTGIKKIINHGEYYPNKNIYCEIFVIGSRGATYNGWVKSDGHVEIMTSFGKQRPTFEGFILYDGTKGCLINPIAVV